LEAAFCKRFNTRYAIAMNSATSCLFGTIQALGIGAGDEVIVTPWTMSASVACVLSTGATPVFADIEPVTFGLDPQSVAERIGSKTRAIITVDLFGCPARWAPLRDLAQTFGLTLIEDAAQAPGALYSNQHAGTLGEVGIFSLNYHKTIQCGEGGVAVTNDPALAEKLCDYRNHGEVRGGKVGGNYRLGEIEAAIATVQLGRLDELTDPRIWNARRLSEGLAGFEGVHVPAVPDTVKHVFYLYPIRIKEPLPGLCAIALRREGVQIDRYVKPLYRLPAFRLEAGPRIRDRYPVVEQAYREVHVTPLIHAGITEDDIDDIISAFQKVWSHRSEL
jgi:dTDP-4-amino-4,6-dideoxygalactose transaminase